MKGEDSIFFLFLLYLDFSDWIGPKKAAVDGQKEGEEDREGKKKGFIAHTGPVLTLKL